MKKIEPGDVILVKGNFPVISRLIRLFTKSEYTHVGIAITGKLIYEIDFYKDLAIRPIKHKSYDVFRYKKSLTKEQKRKMKRYAIKKAQENRGYDFLRIIGFALETIFKRPFSPHRSQKVVCSEIVDNLYNYIGVDLVPDRSDGHVTPAHISKSPELIKIFSYQAKKDHL